MRAGVKLTFADALLSVGKSFENNAFQGEPHMRKILVGVGSIAAAVLAISSAGAQNTIKIGVILPYSGQFADTATQLDNGIKLYMKQNGDTIAGKKIEIIRKDTGGVAPDVAKRLAQELVVRDQVDLLAGFVLTPNALAGVGHFRSGEEIHGDHERGDVDHHDQVALFGARLADAAASVRNLRRLGPSRAACARPTPWRRITARATTARAPIRARSRRPAARSSAR